jgi:hypothetical protein
MKKAWLALPVVAVALAIVGPAAPSSADTNVFGRCPDSYQAVPLGFANAEDRNGNGIVCVKFVANHINQHDDPNGQPYQCNGTDALTDPDCTLVSTVDDILP